ncbi:MAG: hypothetical protein AAF441_29785, partial [Pseudomonadota bacterium]
MNNLQLVEKVAPATTPVEYTHLPDIELYTGAATSTGMVEAPVQPGWSMTLDELSKLFPEVLRRDLALTLISVYVARMSENSEAVFPLKVAHLSVREGGFVPFTLLLAPEDRFTDALINVACEILRSVSGFNRNCMAASTEQYPLAVTA